jgi:two-component system cell cycle response regulator DivK
MVTILVIEDNEMNQDLISRRLKKKGFNVEIASDGELGLRMLKENSPDLVLLDMNLPKIDGWEVARISKSDLQTQNIPIIALTAHAMRGDREKALDAGCDEFETKPIRLKQLLEKIEKLVV